MSNVSINSRKANKTAKAMVCQPKFKSQVVLSKKEKMKQRHVSKSSLIKGGW